MNVDWRGISADADLEAWVEALAAVEAVDRTGEMVARADLEEQLGLSYVDAAEDVLLAWFDGRVVAWGTVIGVPDDRQRRVTLAGAVVPEWRGRGLGAELIDRQIARGEVVAARRPSGVPAWLEVSASAADVAREALFTDAGFAPLRRFHQMRRRIASAVAPVDPPVPVRLIPFAPALDDAVRRAHNEAFADHFAGTVLDPETWRGWVTGSRHFRADLSFVALAADEVAGYALNFLYPDEWAALGYTEGWTHQLGVRRGFRRRGVATALLGATAVAFRAAGLGTATLEVDADSLTGAHSLYERCGYERVRTTVTWSRPLA